MKTNLGLITIFISMIITIAVLVMNLVGIGQMNKNDNKLNERVTNIEKIVLENKANIESNKNFIANNKELLLKMGE